MNQTPLFALIAEVKQYNDDEYIIKVEKSFSDQLQMMMPEDLSKQMEGEWICVIMGDDMPYTGSVTFVDTCRTIRYKPVKHVVKFDWNSAVGKTIQFFKGRKIEVAIGSNIHDQLNADKEFRRAVRDMRRKQKRYFHLAKGGSKEERQVVLKESIAAEALVDRLLGPEGSEDGKLS